MGFQFDRLYIAHVKRLPDLKSRRCRYRTVVPTRIGIPAAKYWSFLLFIFVLGKDVIDLFCQIYIGGLRSDSDKYDVEEAFAQYGKVISTAFSTSMSWRCWCFFLVMGRCFQSKEPESLWDVFANFMTIDPPERKPRAKLDPPSCSSQSPSPPPSTWPAPTTSATSPSPTPPSLGLQPLSSSTPKHPATSLQIC